MAWKKANLPLEGQRVEKQITIAAYHLSIPADQTVLVDIGAVWCPPCVKMNPVIDSLATSKDLNFILVKIDGGEQEQLVKELAIEAFPTFIIYKNGKEIWRKQGIIAREELAEKLQ
jgi:thioredoxin-like negative regulator of GroEL